MQLSLSRRSVALGGLVASAAATKLGFVSRNAMAKTPATPEATATGTGPFSVPDLTYGFDALEPHIDALTMEIHHDKHHGTYVKNLNTAIADYPDLQSLTVEELISSLDAVPDAIRTIVKNNAGGHFNHTLFWEVIGPDPGEPSAVLAEAIDRDLGGMDQLVDDVASAGATQFGSGWAWVISNGGTLSVLNTPNQNNTLMDGSGIPILGVDVWEHAYYLKYQNLRPDYLAAFWNVVNWTAVSEKYAATM